MSYLTQHSGQIKLNGFSLLFFLCFWQAVMGEVLLMILLLRPVRPRRALCATKDLIVTPKEMSYMSVWIAMRAHA
jgi:hypothetical protein